MANIILEQADTTQYNFEESFIVEDLELTSNEKLQKAALQHGGRDTSARTFENRTIVIAGVITQETRSGYELAVKTLFNFVRSTPLKLWPDNTTLDRYMVLSRLTGLKQKFIKPWSLGQVELSFLCEEPFWQDATLVTTNGTVASSAYISFENNGSIETPVKLRVNSVAGGAQFHFNRMSDNARLLYYDLGLTGLATITFDTAEGTVVKGTTNAMRYKYGTFLWLNTGANTFQYVGPSNVHYGFEYRQRYI